MTRRSSLPAVALALVLLGPAALLPAGAPAHARVTSAAAARPQPVPPELVRPAEARDRWSELLPAVRYLRRELRHSGGARVIVHALYVDLCDARVALRATAPEERGRTVSRWAREAGVQVAINGDFFVRPGPRPLGPARGAGRDWPPPEAYYYDAILAMRAGAPPAILPRRPRGGPWTDLVASQERIVLDGALTLSPYVRHSRHRHPRSAVGLTRDARTLILAVVDGRSPRSAGATTPELGVLLRDLGAWQALRLDGGGSSALYVEGRGVLNTPSDGRERAVANHLGVVVDRASSPGLQAWCHVEGAGSADRPDAP